MNKKGFTLIELMASIIILAIISFIAIGVVTKITQQAKKEAAKVSFDAYIKAVDTYLVICKMRNNNCQIDSGYRYFVEANSSYTDYEIPTVGLIDMFVPTVYAAETVSNNTSVYLNDFIHVNGSYPTDG